MTQFRAVCLTVLAFALACNSLAFASGAHFKMIYVFQGGTNPYAPAGAFVVDKQGTLYAAGAGGTGICTDQFGDSFPCGTVFRVAPPTVAGGSWSASELYSFVGPSADGEGGAGSLRFGANGNLFGASQTGGNVACGSFTSPVGCGTIFQLSPPSESGGAWSEAVLYKFQGIGDGDAPTGRVVIDTQGNLYGVTLSDGPMNAGVVYRLSPPTQSGSNWTETVLHAFGASAGDGLIPSSGLVRDRAGNFYGLARAGGNTACNNYFLAGCGVVYRLSPPKTKGAGWTETVIYAFAGGSDGQSPQGELAIDAAGNLYGTTTTGMLSDPGTVFQLSPASGGHWSLTTLHTFHAGLDGSIPSGGVILDSTGNLFGVTQRGGDSSTATGCTNGCGTIYEISSGKGGSTQQILYRFHQNDGSPSTGLVFGRGGYLYGATTPFSPGGVFQLVLPTN